VYIIRISHCLIEKKVFDNKNYIVWIHNVRLGMKIYKKWILTSIWLGSLIHKFSSWSLVIMEYILTVFLNHEVYNFFYYFKCNNCKNVAGEMQEFDMNAFSKTQIFEL